MAVDGFLLCDKPKDFTSNDFLRVLKKKYNEKSVGHSGTLDRGACGLMLYAFGRATRLLKYFIGLDKEYEVLLKFGFKSSTYDGDGEIVAVSDNTVSREHLKALIDANFSGEILQTPPDYSALKVSGRRASDLVRSGKEVTLKPRKVVIYSCEILDFAFPYVRLKINCSSGTYIRSLVNDLGELSGLGAYVVELKRLKIGSFSLSDASSVVVTVDDFIKNLSHVSLSEEQYKGLQNGKRLSARSISFDCDFIFAFFEGKFVGVLEKSGVSGIKLKKQL
ncbi:MAG: tRNA pseudouridine(55) synthase TruB [Candidatus Gracilibacteria bacterium]|jgi:tRNA pseudouridine55 synthase|nr:tRNA pseudouridine(55) synthase TruB [Candidatus Gracilibacteria bacterium]